jgi:hypothetical protein
MPVIDGQELGQGVTLSERGAPFQRLETRPDFKEVYCKTRTQRVAIHQNWLTRRAADETLTARKGTNQRA